MTDLKIGLRRHLDHVQPGIPRAGSPETEVLPPDPRTRSVLDAMELALREQGSAPPDSLTQATALEKVVAGLRALSDRDPQLGALFRLVIDKVLVTTDVDVPGSASVPSAVGIIWIQPTRAWAEQDVVEALVHELTHTLLYLDEQRYTHYAKPEDLKNPSTWVPSAIRDEARPVNGVAHSIIVATEILCLRRDWMYLDRGAVLHGDSGHLYTKARTALDQLRGRPDSWNLLSPRMQHLLQLCQEVMNALESTTGLHAKTGQSFRA